jgi:putative hydrolase of the HAD superfamily
VLGALDAGMQTVWVNRERQGWRHAAQPHVMVTDLTQLCALLAAARPLRTAPSRVAG